MATYKLSISVSASVSASVSVNLSVACHGQSPFADD